MAIDSASKRMSALGFGQGYTLPIPDGTIGAGDRLHILRLYSGISALLIDPGATCRTAASITAAGVSAAITASATGQSITCD